MGKVVYKKIVFIVTLCIILLVISSVIIIPAIKKFNLIRAISEIQLNEKFENAIVSVTAKYEGEKNYLINYNSNDFIHPGSNFKLFTAAASLMYLGQDYTFSTRLFLKMEEDGRKSLVLKGSGDPTLNKSHLESFIVHLKDYVQKNGPFNGDLFYDESIFSGEKYGPGWLSEWKNQYFAVPISGLQLNDNLIEVMGIENADNSFEISTEPLENYSPIVNQLNYINFLKDMKNEISAYIDNEILYINGDTVKNSPFHTSAVIKDPAKFTAEVFKQILVKENIINSDAKIINIKYTTPSQIIYEHKSVPLKDIIYRMLKFSKNNYAETLIRTLGYEIKGEGSQEKGVQVLKEFFKEIEILEQVDAFDGSGMSIKTRATGDAFLSLFDFLSTQKWMEIFWKSLPQSNVDGTLKRRFANAQPDFVVLAKTGTHLHSSSLSGKILKKRGRNIIFSVHIFNHPFLSEESTIKVNPLIDKIVEMLNEQF
ncbi:D-alanyl-D-alanine carboxypeptidase/D-alanyl-D-alanine-endopeptidase [Candidatus Peregrinibacteria bacterium RIFOXYC2_FULL_33_13]|nr:MAG: D-alanyl-D-alanine carboxypeptidase, serine-type, PBP4 family [Candidatus Peregrinibacteria bacterium GW2011_GWA2_33_10]KKP40933.1 MAG: D-alanyl-D-alanine carboxypeptidase precursor [Candidatus Peregrinibacteria bacterium GW2011_GWC2_33_13]OGJ52368.1 MAG: D-alanyl-D-alanine carboxypeptidase/D-alanyl-D-alanine-endopeptidase [Candidatus Peregrinibacteria bacterium RIFOXYC2_FULL_33_13]